MRDLKALLPFPDAIRVLQVTGEELHQALENGVSKWPSEEGRFAAVSGLSYSFKAENPSSSRIDPSWITVGGEPLNLNKVCQHFASLLPPSTLLQYLCFSLFSNTDYAPRTLLPMEMMATKC